MRVNSHSYLLALFWINNRRLGSVAMERCQNIKNTGKKPTYFFTLYINRSRGVNDWLFTFFLRNISSKSSPLNMIRNLQDLHLIFFFNITIISYKRLYNFDIKKKKKIWKPNLYALFRRFVLFLSLSRKVRKYSFVWRHICQSSIIKTRKICY